MNSAVIDNHLIYQQDTRRYAGWALAVTIAVHALIVLWLLFYAAPASKPLAQPRPMDFDLTLQAPTPAVVHAVTVPKSQAVPRPLPEPVPEPLLTPEPVVEPAPVVEAAPPKRIEIPAIVPTPAPVAEAEPPLITATDYADNPAPPYPARAKRLGQQGTVVLRVHVRPDGSVSGVSIAQGSGIELLDTTALEAVRGWRFTPLPPRARAIERVANVPIRFTL